MSRTSHCRPELLCHVPNVVLTEALQVSSQRSRQGAIPTVYAVAVTKRSGQFICAPATPEDTGDMAQSDELMCNLMELTRDLVSEKTDGETVVTI